MSTRFEVCPDWQRLEAVRDTWQGEDPPGWAEATRHARECESCRSAAYRADPALLFQRMPVPELSDDDIEAIKLSVKAIRSGSRLGWHGRSKWARSLTAAVLALAVVSLQGGRSEGRSEVTIEAVESGIESPFGDLPLVEEADPAFGSIIQLESESVSVVLVLAMAGVEGVS